MAISSIHIGKGESGFFAHNSRERKTENSIFSDEENFCSCKNKEAFEIFKSELAARTKKYCENKNRTKLHAKTKTHLSAIVNFNKEHTVEDMQKVCDHLEKTFDTKVIQFAMHRDEGHIVDEGRKTDGTAIKNYHAHIEFMGIDSQGNSITQKLKRKQLIKLQSDVAELLQMQRGHNYTKEKIPRPKRLDSYDHKEKKKAESKIIKIANEYIQGKNATQKDLKEEIKQLRAELQKNKADRQQYAELEQLNRDLKQQIKSKDLTIDKMKSEIDLLKYQNKKLNKEVEHLKSVIEVKDQEIENAKQLNSKYLGTNQELLKAITELKREKRVLDDKLLDLEKKSVSRPSIEQENGLTIKEFAKKLDNPNISYSELQKKYENYMKLTKADNVKKLDNTLDEFLQKRGIKTQNKEDLLEEKQHRNESYLHR